MRKSSTTRGRGSIARWTAGLVLIVSWILLSLNGAPLPAAESQAGSGRAPRERTLLLERKQPAEEDEVRKDYDASCLRSGCHAGLAARAWVHSPVSVTRCGACHEAVPGEAEHRFRSSRSEEKLCTFCHEIPAAQAVVHEAYRDRKCLGCHDPHGGVSNRILRTAEEDKLCAGECHDPRMHPGPAEDATPRAYRQAHEPVAEGKCLVCHKAHQSMHEALLVGSESGICLSCHPGIQETLAAAPYIHADAGNQCSPCHLPHGADAPHLLRAEGDAFCLRCHEAVAETIARRGGFHGASERKDYCLACHEPHGAAHHEMLKEPVSEGCFVCHDRELTLDSGRTIADIQSVFEESRSRHGAGLEGECRACHNGHDSTHRDLLRLAYPKTEYAKYSDRAYEICYSCHDKRIITQERSTLTGFRDGDRNLHYLHVHREKGRSCALCHAPHGSRFQKLIRAEVRFGPEDWKLRIEFQETPRGGTCTFSCHQELSYDNSSPPPDPRSAHAALLDSRHFPGSHDDEPKGTPEDSGEREDE